MKTNKFTSKRISILLSLTAVLFFAFNINAQVDLDASNNVGIGTASPNISAYSSAYYRVLSLLGPNTSANSCGILELASKSTDAAGNLAGVLSFTASSNATGKKSIAEIVSWTQGTTSANRGGFMTFNTKPDGSTSTSERMRIDNIGNVGIGTSTPGAQFEVYKDIWVGQDYLNNRRIYFGLSGYQAKIGYNATTGNLDITPRSGYHTVITAGNFGIGATPGSNKFWVSGNSYFSGNISYTGTLTFVSDQQFKTNIDSISNALSLINQLKPRSFYFDTTNVYGLNFSGTKQYGLIAQDVDQVLPELVSNLTIPAVRDTAGVILEQAVPYKTLNYNAFTAILIKGIQEQQQKIDSLKTKTKSIDSLRAKNTSQDALIASLQNQLNALTSTINSCCDDKHDNGNHNGHQKVANNQTNVELNDAQSVILLQNIPNPFAEQTTISYSLPDNTVKAQMLFYNAQGKLIQSTELSQKGKGTLNVFASDLSSGIYTYTLVVDGKIIETKKMVKQ